MKNKFFLKGTSIIETVIAITIITLCSLISTLVYTSVINQAPLIEKYEYQYELEKLIQETIENKNLTTFKREFNGYAIEKSIAKDAKNIKLNNITFLITLNKKTIKHSLMVFDPIENEEN